MNSIWTNAHTNRALQIWAEYQQRHDLTEHIGQTAGIDPDNSTIRFGSSALEIAEQLRSEGQEKPLFFVRVGYDHYLRKGRKR